MESLIRKQLRASGHITRSFDNLKKLGQANITLGVVEAKIAVLDSKWEAFASTHDEIDDTATSEDRKDVYFASDVYGTTEEGYFVNRGKFLDLARRFKTPGDESAVRQTPAAQQLPKINLPKFSGDFTEWPSFRDLFTSMVGDNKSLSAIEKMHYLKMSLVKEPAALLASIPLTAENLNTAWKTLVDRYDNIRLLTTAQISSICTLQPMKSESSLELKTLFNGTVNAVSALRALGRPVDGYSDFLVHLTVQKLDKQSRREWESSMGSKKTPPTFAELHTFLEARICAVQALEPTGSQPAATTKTSGPSSSESRMDSKPSGRVKSHQASSAPTSSKKCALCQQEHYIVFCDGFRAKSLDEKKAFVLANNLCINCLGRHFVRECRSQKVCQVCKAKHHTMIHGAGSNASGPAVTGPTGTSRGESSIATTSEQPNAPPTVSLAATNVRCNAIGSSTRVLLATAVVNTFTAGGISIPVRAMLDRGSEASFVSESLAQRLRLPRASASVAITGIGAKSMAISRGRVSIRISSRLNSSFELEFGALVLPQLTAYAPPRIVASGHWSHLEGLSFADPDYTSNLRIDLLLGTDVFSQLLLPGVRKGSLDAPIAQNTQLGWILSGRVAKQGGTSVTCASHQISIDHHLSTSLQRFWEQEELPASSPLTEEDRKCEEHFLATHTRDSDDRYIVRLPLKEPLVTLGDSLSAASRMLSRMEQRFARDVTFATAYSEFLSEYEDLHHMELVSSAEKNPELLYYLPHHGVIRESSETTKLRVVFNGSQKTNLGISLNDCLHVGPPLLPELVDVLLRWRRHAVVFSADMEKMYRQILLHPDDRDLQRILWRPISRSKPDAYRLRTVTYGLACAPYLALRVIKPLALDGKVNFPRGSESLLTDVYVDDVLSGADDVASALSRQPELIELLKAGGFSLRKWTSNSSELLSHLSPSVLASGTSFSIPSEETFHMLGLSWQAETDCFVFRLKTPQCEQPLTKRRMLSKIAELFDPFGWLAPVTVKAKIFMQALWLLKLGWDEALPSAESDEWLTFCAHLPSISNLRISRWMGIQSASRDIEIHGFADASERAYAAVVYLCVASPSRSVTLVAAKTKVAPVKQISLPRLELCGAHLLVKLVKHIIGVLNLNCPIHLWSDSTVTLAWIQGHPVRWKTYVANRVSEIQRTLPDALWHHVESRQNPADCASRGLLGSEIQSHVLWWNGPHWLLSSQEAWPTQTRRGCIEPPEQRLLSHNAVRKCSDPVELLTRYSSLNRLQRIVAWCQRFISNSRLRGAECESGRKLSSTLLPSELASSLLCIIKLEQLRLFRAEVMALEAHSALPKGPLLRFNPFLDDQGLLRIGGRLKHAVLDSDDRHPVIVPRESPLTPLLIDQVHRKTLHGGTQLTLATLRQQFWITAGRSLVKTFIGRCIRCLRFRAATATQLMGNLPRESYAIETVLPYWCRLRRTDLSPDVQGTRPQIYKGLYRSVRVLRNESRSPRSGVRLHDGRISRRLQAIHFSAWTLPNYFERLWYQLRGGRRRTSHALRLGFIGV